MRSDYPVDTTLDDVIPPPRRPSHDLGVCAADELVLDRHTLRLSEAPGVRGGKAGKPGATRGGGLNNTSPKSEL